jgi:hypothetical protein
MFYIRPDQIQLLGVSGQIGNGKSTLTRVAVREFGFHPLSLARHFKVDTVAKDGMDPLAVFGASEHKTPESRHALQQRGTELGRNVYGKDVWLKHAEAHIYDLIEHGATRIIVPDVRYANEVEWIHALGGRVYRVFGRQPEVTEGHPSEIELNGWGYSAPGGSRGFDRRINNCVGCEEQTLSRFRRSLTLDYDERGQLAA